MEILNELSIGSSNGVNDRAFAVCFEGNDIALYVLMENIQTYISLDNLYNWLHVCVKICFV